MRVVHSIWEGHLKNNNKITTLILSRQIELIYATLTSNIHVSFCCRYCCYFSMYQMVMKVYKVSGAVKEDC